MALYKVSNNKLTQIKQNSFKLEKDLQKLVEQNLFTLFNLQYVTSEFTVNNLRIDTLAFDEETNSFVIIEYKKTSSFSVIDQGYSYLAQLLNNKADFVLEYNEKTNKTLQRSNVDWSQSKIIFIAQDYTRYQKEAINFNDLPIEIWEAKKYSENLFSVSQIQASEKSESIKTVSKNENIQKVSQEVKTFTLDDHFKSGWDSSKSLYDSLNEIILSLDQNITKSIHKHYIAYKINGKNFAEIISQASGLKVYLDIYKNKLKENGLKITDCSKVGHWATGDSFVKVENEEDLSLLILYIKQSYTTNKR